MIATIAFYLFATLTIAPAVFVIFARNPVHSVLWLILAFVNASALFVLMGAEFLAMILIVVYVGAVAVLFLFVVMMLDVDFTQLRQGFLNYLPVGAVIGLIFAVELVLVVFSWAFAPEASSAVAMPIPDAITNTEAIGRLLYTDPYVYFFEAAGIILLVAMIGAIVLTLRHKVGVKRQSISAQNARRPATAIDIVKIPSGGFAMPDQESARVKEQA